MNNMQEIRIEKITLNMGVGQAGDPLDRGVKLIETISGLKAVRTKTNKRIPTWNVRPGLDVGCRATLRKEKMKILKNLLIATKNQLRRSQFSGRTLSFGIPEYIDIPDVNYDPEIGIVGLQVSVTLSRPGYRITRRNVRKAKIKGNKAITTEETIAFIKEKFGVEVEE